MSIYKIIDEKAGIFTVENAHKQSGLYFPLTNTQGALFSCITPFLTGDIKTSVNSFLNYPQSIYDLNSATGTRSFWIRYNGKVVNLSPLFTDNAVTSIEAGPLFHKFTNKLKGIKAEILSFVPENMPAEVMSLTLTNTGKNNLSIETIFAMPLFARSADNQRDHRHVTALLARSRKTEYGVEIKPTMCFDERGHTVNHIEYFVYGYKGGFTAPKNIVTCLEDFLGDGGTHHRPGYIFNKKTSSAALTSGREPFAGLDFGIASIAPGKSLTINIIMGVSTQKPSAYLRKLNSADKIEKEFIKSRSAWNKVYNTFNINGDKDMNFWFKWVNMQPTFRKLFGCSFLPHFDYGRGGRGWRDLWQDLLGLLLFNPEETRETLINNFKGVRIDGSNATIITNDGGFLADRNRISRVWMDHGVWPWLTLKLYLDQTGDFDVLFENIPYFKDNLLNRAKLTQPDFPETDNQLRAANGRVHLSTILEHTIVQNLVQFYNTGAHGNIKLEDADWNDGLDMAHNKGESVAFTCMYAHNLREIAQTLKTIRLLRGLKNIELTSELDILIKKCDYTDTKARNKALQQYFTASCRSVSGVKKSYDIEKLADSLTEKADSSVKHLRKNEWMPSLGFFNGYYDNSGRRVEGKINGKVRATLTSAVFAIMSGTATEKQCGSIYCAMKKYLQEKESGTFKLNTDFNETKLDLGRAFAFAYGEKENGAVFAHMDVMFAFALYKRGMVKEGFDLLSSLFNLATSQKAGTYPCISEYYNGELKGLYNFLTGSASWMTYLLVTQVFGIKHKNGDLTVEPKLSSGQFKKNTLTFTVNIDGNPCDIVYKNPDKLDYGTYRITGAKINGIICAINNPAVLTIEKTAKHALLNKKLNKIELLLD